MMILAGLVVFILFLALSASIWALSIYNRLVALRNRIKNAWAQIDVQLKRRYDLIPNLVEAAKAYLKHERETLEAVIAARNHALVTSNRVASSPSTQGRVQDMVDAEAQLTGALSRLMVVAEQYPELKAQATINQLMEELSSTENKVGFARQAYNDSVLDYNTTSELFPNLVIAQVMRFEKADLFEVKDANVRDVPKVAFG